MAMTPAVEIRGLRFAYEDVPALQGVDVTVAEGECVGVVGPNGAGKSTLLLHLNGILPEDLPDEPRIFIAGQPVARHTLHDIRRKVGLLFQDPDDQIFCPTVYEDVAFGPAQFDVSGEELSRVVAAALAQVRLSGFERRSPHHLSLGEKRRVCLAGVLACEPAILVLDEPTSGLDPRGKHELVGLLRTGRRGAIRPGAHDRARARKASQPAASASARLVTPGVDLPGFAVARRRIVDIIPPRRAIEPHGEDSRECPC
jgi:cobalt/nickel transport system ATP-binding protein